MGLDDFGAGYCLLGPTKEADFDIGVAALARVSGSTHGLSLVEEVCMRGPKLKTVKQD